jgi:hypothetical protein
MKLEMEWVKINAGSRVRVLLFGRTMSEHEKLKSNEEELTGNVDDHGSRYS